GKIRNPRATRLHRKERPHGGRDDGGKCLPTIGKDTPLETRCDANECFWDTPSRRRRRGMHTWPIIHCARRRTGFRLCCEVGSWPGPENRKDTGMDTFKPEMGKPRTHNPPVNSCTNPRSAIYREFPDVKEDEDKARRRLFV